MAQRLTTADFIERARKKHCGRYGYSKVTYQNAKIHVTVTCEKHGDFAISPNNHLSGKGCRKCAGKGLTTAEYIQRFREIHGDRYDYSEFGPCENVKTKYTFICPEHGRFQQTADGHLRGGCFRCAVDERAVDRVAGNRATFEEDCRRVHGDKYNYSKVDYKNIKMMITIICPTHGEFEQVADRHKRGGGCPECKRELLTRIHTKTPEQFVRDAEAVHGNLHDYSQVKYAGSDTKVTIFCREHGEFQQMPPTHLSGAGCPRCAGSGLNTEIFVQQCREVHGDLYDYSKTKYRSVVEPIIVGCPIHGDFEQSARKHRRNGCPLCGVEKAGKSRRSNKAVYLKRLPEAYMGIDTITLSRNTRAPKRRSR